MYYEADMDGVGYSWPGKDKYKLRARDRHCVRLNERCVWERESHME